MERTEKEKMELEIRALKKRNKDLRDELHVAKEQMIWMFCTILAAAGFIGYLVTIQGGA